MINGRASPYECIGIELYTDNGPYQGKGLIKYARLELSSERVTTARIPEKTIELILQSTGLTKAERKIKRRLISERITIPQNEAPKRSKLRGILNKFVEIHLFNTSSLR